MKKGIDIMKKKSYNIIMNIYENFRYISDMLQINILANLLKNEDAKLEGLTRKRYDSQL